jgi:hypothetical protein
MTRGLAYLALGALPLFGCELWDTPMSDPDCASATVDADAELLLTMAWLREDPRARNTTADRFGFAGQLAALHQRYPGFDAQALWSLVGQPVPSRDGDAPFRLLALVNRTDLAEQLAPESPAGEARLVYQLTRGPGDDATAPAQPFTVIFEYSLGSERTARDWSAAFHALALLDDGSTPSLAQATYDLVQSFASPRSTADGPHLSQLRVNDARRGVPELYELALDDTGKLVARGLRNTPRLELAGSPELLAFADEHADAIASGTHRVPRAWLAESARVEPIAWLGASPSLDHAFSRGTCSGCHGAEGPAENGFHLSEADDGSVKLSRFLREEELPRRAQWMRAQLCGDDGR